MFGASAASPWSRFLNRAVSSSSFSVHQTPETLATVAGSPSLRLEAGRPCAVVEGKRRAAGCSMLVNTSCRLVNLTAHLRQKAGLPPDASLHVLPATIALLAEDGNLVSLEEDLKEGAAQTQTMGNSLLKERAIYVLVRTISKRERTWSPPAMSPYWRTWMTITQSWQVSVRVQPRGRAHLLPSPYQQDFPGLPEELRRLSGLSSAGHNWRKRMGTRRGRHEQSPTSRPRKGPD
ncbi:uncharacterized protein C22orf15 homolog isoform X7 [Rhinopithecus roxellana]|uniref:uncharacterized protein C22orf15 homolog isoform X7 n=1 Tax=Rhinopithecus roxellana TaxID=61622 RepID=UPI00123767C3|nr:uncharacterized protein C22orf15 homolog isoform X7 [Rhinopithecus roxellana]